mmetsp:Transcript_12996/g.35405  ORF Transcript_12996/g.35405 Transcript_12996/m.35405 type:complete len:112 (-) Transcript_12996:2625-2960(-)
MNEPIQQPCVAGRHIFREAEIHGSRYFTNGTGVPRAARQVHLGYNLTAMKKRKKSAGSENTSYTNLRRQVGSKHCQSPQPTQSLCKGNVTHLQNDTPSACGLVRHIQTPQP